MNGNIWFTSDTHYGHANVIKHCNRPFEDIEEMRETMIANYNSLVKPGDAVYFLGDFSFERKPQETFHRLNGTKHLILGNHDKKHIERLPWAWVKNVYKLKVKIADSRLAANLGANQKIWLSHYAHRTWPHSHKGSIHLYGHSHGDLDRGRDAWGRSCDVGVDAWDYRPVHLDEILELMKNRDLTYHHAPRGKK